MVVIIGDNLKLLFIIMTSDIDRVDCYYKKIQHSICMRPSHGDTTLKQEVRKLKVFIMGLFNPSMRHVSR